MYKKLTKKEKLRREADKLWQLILMRRYKGRCFVCGKKAIEVHHFVPKQQCLALRYDLENGIPTCRSCHFQIHFKSDPLIPLIIAFKKGKNWVKYLQEKKKEKVQMTTEWLEEQIKKLRMELES
uniref:HNH endonuclease n=1 Tax=candidate division CPR3 bacterium TaxID=2268181 RepID=A0A7V3JAD4_UNCC3